MDSKLPIRSLDYTVILGRNGLNTGSGPTSLRSLNEVPSSMIRRRLLAHYRCNSHFVSRQARLRSARVL